eukprot:GABV01008984.1.p1 GENE.GABV01008984.1~~GABV01008984.1.p1  ORF type:complete len:246 (+),score=57.32 GABV01008984.1:2-739(+)
MFRAFNRFWCDLQDAFDSAWSDWPRDPNWPQLEPPFRPSTTTTTTHDDTRATPAAAGATSTAELQRSERSERPRRRSASEPHSTGDLQVEDSEEQPTGGYERYYSHQSSFYRDADGQVQRWAEGTERCVHPSGAMTETHSRRMGDQMRVTTRKRAADAGQWELEEDSIRYAQQLQEKKKEERMVREKEPNFEEFDREWEALVEHSWPWGRRGRVSIEGKKKAVRGRQRQRGRKSVERPTAGERTE